MIRDLYDWVLSWSESAYAVPALFCLAFAESSFFPLPPDVLLMALVLGQPESGMYLAGVTTLGSVLGGLLGYGIGWVGGRPLLLRYMGADRVQTIHQTFERYEGWAILIAGFTPIPYKVFTIGAGAFYVNLKVFTLASALSRGARFFLVAGAIQWLGPWMKEMIESYFNIFSIAFVLLLILGFYVVKVQTKRVSGVKQP